MTGELPRGRVSDALIQTIRDRVTLSHLVGKHVILKRSHHNESVGICPFHQEKTPSFTVNDAKGFFHCFGCGIHGDAVDFTRRIYRMSFRDAVAALASEHGLDGAIATVDPQISARAERRRAQDEARAQRIFAAALEIWHHAVPAENSPVERYLRSRAITGPIPPSLRYHPELRYKITDKQWLILPAMVAEVCNSDGETIAIHRTFLKRDGSGKADVAKDKLMLGDPHGGGIYLGPAGPQINVTEGIETGLSLQEINGLPTIAAASTGFMRVLQLPPLPLAAKITIGADNDQPGAQAAIAAATRWRDEGRDVRIIKPRELKDYNDVLQRRRLQVLSP